MVQFGEMTTFSLQKTFIPLEDFYFTWKGKLFPLHTQDTELCSTLLWVLFINFHNFHCDEWESWTHHQMNTYFSESLQLRALQCNCAVETMFLRQVIIMHNSSYDWKEVNGKVSTCLFLQPASVCLQKQNFQLGGLHLLP